MNGKSQSLSGTAGTRAALYFRVSSDKQTTECQRPDVMALVAHRGLSVVAEFDEQRSACKIRPEFNKMLAAAEAGQFDVLVIWALDRFGRSMPGNLNDVLALDKLGVRVVSVKEPWMDTAGPVRELLVAIFGWVAQHERLRLIERTRAGIANSRRTGTQWGRRCKTMVKPPEREAQLVLWNERGRPNGFNGLAKMLGGCSNTMARRLWLASAYAGLPAHDSTDVQNTTVAEPDASHVQNTAVPQIDVLD